MLGPETRTQATAAGGRELEAEERKRLEGSRDQEAEERAGAAARREL
jgi:hypothetical protein